METVLAIVVGGLFASGFYLMLRRSVVKLIIGLGLLGHAFNVLIFTVGGLERGEPPLIAAAPLSPVPPEDQPAAAEAAQEVARETANPLPQALILTAIVIGFAIQAFAMVLGYRTVQAVGRDDLDMVGESERARAEPVSSHASAEEAEETDEALVSLARTEQEPT